VADGDLDRVRKSTRRIGDLKADLDALSQGRALLEAQVARDSEARIVACDVAAAELQPSLEDVCTAIERFEEALIAANAAYIEVGKAHGRFEAARSACKSSLPDLPSLSRCRPSDRVSTRRLSTAPAGASIGLSVASIASRVGQYGSVSARKRT
jgi:hypothetical protein